MKCPLLLPLIYQLGGLPDGIEDECKREECAWWAGGEKACAVLVLAAYLAGAVVAIGVLTDKMPHEAQFRR